MNYFKLDYTIESPEDRCLYIQNLIDNMTEEERQYLSPAKLDRMADYIIFAQDKKERKEKKILTENRLFTINKRETSYEGLLTKFENGEDGIYNLISDNKNIRLTQKKEITEKDKAEVPGLKDLVSAIEYTEEKFKKASGRDKFLLKKHLIQMRQDQYILKENYYQPIKSNSINSVKGIASLDLTENIIFNEKGEPVSDCLINLFDADSVSAILCNYSAIKEEVYDKLQSDAYFLMIDFDNAAAAALEKKPIWEAIVTAKIDGASATQIQEMLLEKFDIKYSVEYLSVLWRKKIPKLISEYCKEQYLLWYYTFVEYGEWKRCSRCGQIKLKHNRFFSKNSTSKDGYYSICKECRNKKEEK